MAGAVTEDEAKKAMEDAEARKDLFFVMGLMGVVVVVVALLMVCLFLYKEVLVTNYCRPDLPGTSAHDLILRGRT